MLLILFDKIKDLYTHSMLFEYDFESDIQMHSLGFNKKGELFYSVIFLPEDLIAKLPLKKYPRLRVEGGMDSIPFEAALQPAKGKWYLIVSNDFMKRQNLKLGDSVKVHFNIADQEYIDIPSELQNALNQDSDASEIWNTLTTGKKRGYAVHVAGAKQSETRVRRAEKMITYILEGKNAGGRLF